jgi:hypothetical protein
MDGITAAGGAMDIAANGTSSIAMAVLADVAPVIRAG